MNKIDIVSEESVFLIYGSAICCRYHENVVCFTNTLETLFLAIDLKNG